MNIDEMARNMGFNDEYLNKLKASNNYITESANNDRNVINSQLNQTLSDYNREREKQNGNFTKEAQNAYIDYAKSINPYSNQNSNANRIGLGESGYAESSKIGANNTYQNRYTDNKTNYDNIFADINNNMAKARETSNIELAKIAKGEQDRMLENLYRYNDQFTAQKQWEAEMALQKQQLAASRAKSRSSGGSSLDFRNGSGDDSGDNSKTQTNSYADNFWKTISDSDQTYSASVWGGKINQLVNSGTISGEEAQAITRLANQNNKIRW